MFHSARLTLTAWYLMIIMTISLLFSWFIYNNVNREYVQFEYMQQRIVERLQQGQRFRIPPGTSPDIFDPEIVPRARARLITTLGAINLIIFAVAGGAGYFLAGRTLRPIQKMVDEQKRFVSDASHELRTPLTSLRSEIEVGLRNKGLRLSEAKELLHSNLEEVISLQSLSDNLLSLAQFGKPRNNTVFVNVSISECIEGALKKLHGNIMKKNMTINKKTVDVVVLGVPDRLTELFVILLDNAIKYSPEKSTITIVTKLQKGKVAIEIKDEGIGISEEDIPFIFDRFYRASKSRAKTTVSGYGLGLSIAKQIVHMHNGTVHARSKEGKGTTFTITLPLMKG